MNSLGLIGYVLLPTAPPRLLPELGFVDTLARSGAVNHGSALVELVANPYAAMPSLHAADALILGVALSLLVENRAVKVLFVLYPVWVCFSLLATANHFWIDVVAGIALAVVGAAVARPVSPPPARDRSPAASTAVGSAPRDAGIP
jgi:membrane-associated phospholipid phosphatase